MGWGLVEVNRRVARDRSTRPDDEPLRVRLSELAAEHRRFGYRGLDYLPAREGMPPNHDKLLCINRKKGLRVLRLGACKRALGTRAPMTTLLGRTSPGLWILPPTVSFVAAASASCVRPMILAGSAWHWSPIRRFRMTGWPAI